jgi:hypothetical protein
MSLHAVQAPDADCLERFLGRLPLVMNVVIMSPHGYFGQSNVLGLPDTGGQVRGVGWCHELGGNCTTSLAQCRACGSLVQAVVLGPVPALVAAGLLLEFALSQMHCQYSIHNSPAKLRCHQTLV